MKKVYEILITGHRKELQSELPAQYQKKNFHWHLLPVLEFEKLPVPVDQLKNDLETADWLIFASARAVDFFFEIISPSSVQHILFAAIGEKTALLLENVSQEVLFPRQKGTEGFLKEFLTYATPPKKVILPCALDGRSTLMEELLKSGFEVKKYALYQSVANKNISLEKKDFKNMDAFIFTSPLSFESFKKVYDIPKNIPLFCLGSYTQTHLSQKGFFAQVLDQWADIGEYL